MKKIPRNELMDSSFEQELSDIILKNEDYRYLPWIGCDFKSQSKKLMIVAESVYLWGEGTEVCASEPDFGRTILYDQALDFDNNFKSKPMFPNFMKAFTGLNNIDNGAKNEFWKSVVFHELVQVPMANEKSRPTKNDFNTGAKYLVELVELLLPNTIIIFGTDWRNKYVPIKMAFENLQYKTLSQIFFDKINRSYPRVLTMSKADHEVKIIFMKHPSQRFSPQKWHLFIAPNI